MDVGLICVTFLVVIILLAGHLYSQRHPEARFPDNDDNDDWRY